MGDIKTRFTLEGESQFRSAMTNAANAIKVLNAEQKLAKASFQQTGNAEKYAAQQADILKQKIANQKAAVQAAQQAIKQLTDSGVSPASRQFQQWQTKLLNAQTALTNMETELQNVNSTMQQTTDTAQGTGEAIETIGEKVSFDAVLNGIGKVTDFLESAAQKAKQFAEEIINFTREAASEADDIATTASIYNTTTQEVQQARYTADILDTSAETIMKSRQKLAKAMESESEAFKEIGVSFYQSSKTGKVMRDWEDVFWEVGDALVRIQDEKGFEYVNDQATKLFGRGWEQLRPIFASDWASEDNYLGKAFNSAREYYEAVMASWDVNSDETMKNLTKYDDSIQKLQNNLDTLQLTVAGQLAPGFKEVTDFVSDLVSEFNKYLESDEGKEKLNDLSDAVVELFKGLTDVDFGTALDTAKGAIDGLTTGLKWIKKNWGAVKAGLEALAVAFGGLKIAEGVLTFMQLFAAGKYLTASEAAAAGATAGTHWAAAFASAAMKASPFLAFMYTLLNPGATAVDDYDVLYDENGNPTSAGREAGMTLTQQEEEEAEAARRENQKRVEETRKRNERNLKFKRIEHDLLEEEEKSAEIDKDRADLISQRNERKTTWNPLLSVGIGEDLLPEEAQYWLRGMYAPWSQFTDEDFNMTDILMPWKGVTKLLSQNLPSENQPVTNFMDINVPVNPEVDANAAGEIAEQVGPVEIPAQLTVTSITTGGGFSGFANYFDNLSNLFGRGYANGLPEVPFDGYRAILHKGERVVPAREVQSQNYSSNLYVESMYMNNGTDAAGLAAAMAAAQRRQMSGYGS